VLINHELRSRKWCHFVPKQGKATSRCYLIDT
jgi:hypothetical protein